MIDVMGLGLTYVVDNLSVYLCHVGVTKNSHIPTSVVSVVTAAGTDIVLFDRAFLRSTCDAPHVRNSFKAWGGTQFPKPTD